MPQVVFDPARSALLLGFLRRARAAPESDGWVLRGSLMLGAICPGARPAADVDYVLPGRFDPARCEARARAVAAMADAETDLAVERCEVIFGETLFPGLRAFLTGRSRDGESHFHVDFAHGDPLPAPPRPVEIAGVGDVLACTAETLFGWKLHGLVEFGKGTWRAKDLFDLWLMATRLPLDPEALRTAVALAFESRDLPLSALDDLRLRPAWGESRSGRRKWRSFARKHAGAPAFEEARGVLRGMLDALLGEIAEGRGRRVDMIDGAPG